MIKDIDPSSASEIIYCLRDALDNIQTAEAMCREFKVSCIAITSVRLDLQRALRTL